MTVKKEYNITVRLTKSQLDRLILLSNALKVSRAETMRQALDNLFLMDMENGNKIREQLERMNINNDRYEMA